MTDPKPFDPERIIRVLAQHDVAYVLVGALAARLQGFPRLTADADITPDGAATNLARLARALRDLEARVFTGGVPEGLDFDCSAATLQNAEMWDLVTNAGRLDLVFRPAGTGGYEDLRESAVRFEVFGATLYAASLSDIARSKMAADRPQDGQDVAVINEILKRQGEVDSREA